MQRRGGLRTALAAAVLAFALPIAALADGSEPELPTIKFNARLIVQHDSFDGVYSEEGNRLAATYPRRARIGISGRLAEPLKYALDVDFDLDGVLLKTAELSWTGLGFGTLSAGRFDPDFGLEHATSSNWTIGVERSAMWDLAPDIADIEKGYGAQFDTVGAHVYASAGVFHWPNGNGATARFVYAPILAERRVLHLGVSLAGQRLDAYNGRIRTRLGVRGVSETDGGNRITLAPKLDDGAFDHQRLVDLEFAAVHGALSLQAEALWRRLTGNVPARTATGAYAQIAWTLTGEARRYDLDGAKFRRFEAADPRIGVWEVFYRHDWLRVRGEPGMLGDGRDSGTARANVFGVNWYANKWLRLSLNVLRGRTGGIVNDVGNEAGTAYSLRLQMVY